MQFTNLKGPKQSKVATAQYLYLLSTEFDVCVKLWAFGVKVPIIFSGPVGFPSPMEGRFNTYVRRRSYYAMQRSIAFNT